ncbi:MAG: hypothetical protein M3N43_09570 [Actinomycetota bacterium]|nr:hypothetical protein [Actinomycetota bacterium]
MISSQALRQIAETGLDRISITGSGEPLETGHLPQGTLIPALVVGKITEAVKQMETGSVARYLNRDALWAVRGFVLDRQVVSSLPDGVESAADLIEAVRQAGIVWHAVLV